jgi:transcriptional regulator with XRE-family HTH domain
MELTQRRLVMRLKKIRAQRGLTQEGLADKAGVSRQYLSRLETGRHDPSLSTLVKLAKALKVKVTDLLE